MDQYVTDIRPFEHVFLQNNHQPVALCKQALKAYRSGQVKSVLCAHSEQAVEAYAT